MKLRHLLLVTAIPVGFGTAAMAAQDQGSQSQSSTSAAQGSSQQSMQGMEHDPQMVRQLQQKLKQEGFHVGEIDGKWGPQTQSALRQWQQKQGMTASGELDQQSLAALGLEDSGMTGSSAQGATAGRDNSSGTSGTTGNSASTSAAGGSPGSTAAPSSGAGTGTGGNAR